MRLGVRLPALALATLEPPPTLRILEDPPALVPRSHHYHDRVVAMDRHHGDPVKIIRRRHPISLGTQVQGSAKVFPQARRLTVSRLYIHDSGLTYELFSTLVARSAFCFAICIIDWPLSVAVDSRLATFSSHLFHI